ncbi:hypothetical protein AMTR_s00057p00202540 [Amborella trichopoda]|uniref:Uncharacterized protein n=1 Tax=Amborella trichopoda TaxID=13333 RepID=U5D999_AMBTC|nr:hypothetical protein AMTR_s00057p00202540 [Amborella trichopoda]
METSIVITANDVEKEKPINLFSPKQYSNETVFLSNIDQTVAFPVETVFFFQSRDDKSTEDIAERVKKSVSLVLVPYWFMSGRLSFNCGSHRLELVCNNAGVLFRGAMSQLRVDELGDLAIPNPTSEHFILRIDGLQGSNVEVSQLGLSQITAFLMANQQSTCFRAQPRSQGEKIQALHIHPGNARQAEERAINGDPPTSIASGPSSLTTRFHAFKISNHGIPKESKHSSPEPNPNTPKPKNHSFDTSPTASTPGFEI